MQAQPDSGGNIPEADAFDLINVFNTFRVNANNTTTDLVEITARSHLLDVYYTWDILKSTFDGEGAPAAAQLKTEQVNQIGLADHVYALRTEADQDKSGVLFNYLVVTVGTDDGAITTDVSIRMDNIGLPSAFQQIDDAWKRLQALGAK